MVVTAFTMKFPIPPSANNLKRIVTPKSGRPFMASTREADAYRTEVGWRCKQYGLRAPFPGRVQIYIRMYPSRPQDWKKRVASDPMRWDDTVLRIDLDNARKALYDALQGVAFINDKLVFKDGGEVMEPDGGEARLIVSISAYEREANPQTGFIEEPPLPSFMDGPDQSLPF